MSKISWSKALADYLKDETQSYTSIARRYGVSKQSVVKRAVKESWQDLRHKTLLEVDQKLTEIVGEDIAIVNARQAQIGRALQALALKTIQDKDFKPENFIQAMRVIVAGVKIERETLDMREAKREGEVVGRSWGIFNNPEMAKEYSMRKPVTQSPKPLLAVPVNKPPEQVLSNKPLVDPKVLEQIQERLLEMQGNLNRLKKKLDAKQAEIQPSTSLSGWH